MRLFTLKRPDLFSVYNHFNVPKKAVLQAGQIEITNNNFSDGVVLSAPERIDPFLDLPTVERTFLDQYLWKTSIATTKNSALCLEVGDYLVANFGGLLVGDCEVIHPPSAKILPTKIYQWATRAQLQKVFEFDGALLQIHLSLDSNRIDELLSLLKEFGFGILQYYEAESQQAILLSLATENGLTLNIILEGISKVTMALNPDDVLFYSDATAIIDTLIELAITFKTDISVCEYGVCHPTKLQIDHAGRCTLALE